MYDIYHPVVDYTNLLVVGITGAFAWELPSKPVHPDEELEELFKNGSLTLLRRNDDDEVEINNIRNEIITGMLLCLKCMRSGFLTYAAKAIVNVQLTFKWIDNLE